MINSSEQPVNTQSYTIHVDLNRKDFIEKLKESLSKNEHVKKASNAIGQYLIEVFIDSLDYETITLESLVDLAIEKLESSGGVCLYDWHRAPFDPSENNTNICNMCGKTKDEHELVACCDSKELDIEK